MSTTPSLRPSAPAILFGRYQLLAPLAKGGTATVYVARMLGAQGFSRHVALKRLLPHFRDNPEVVAMLLDEARVAAHLRHPCIIPVIDVVHDNDEVVLVQEYVHGLALSRFLSSHSVERPTPPPAVTVAVLLGLLSALDAAHEATDDHGAPLGIVHRDVSPQNVLLGVDGLPRLIDFGVAKANTNQSVTQHGHLRGKLAYMPPEQLHAEAVDRTADIYAVGIMLWEMLEGRRRYPRCTDVELVSKILQYTQAPLVAEHALPFAEVVAKATAPHPADRYQTAEEMAHALTEVTSPASPKDVAAWMRRTSGEVLNRLDKFLSTLDDSAEQDTALADILSVGSSVMTGQRVGQPAGDSTGTDDEVAPASNSPRSLPGAVSMRDVPSVLPAAPQVQGPAAPNRHTGWLVLFAVLLASLVVAVGALVVTREPAPQPVSGAATTPASAATVPALAVPSGLPTGLPTAFALGAPGMTAGAAAAPTQSTPLASTAAPLAVTPSSKPFGGFPNSSIPVPRPTVKPNMEVVPTPSTAPANCKIPYYFDGETKKFKPECL